MNIDRSIKPEPAKEISFALPAIERFTLQSGLNVIFVRKNNLPLLQFYLMIEAGNKFDPQNKKGLANLTAMTIDEGAGNYDALQLSDEFDLIGSHFDINTGNDYTYFSLQTLTEYFDRSLELFCDVLLKPHFKNSAFYREQRKIITRIMQVKDNPEEIADTAFEYLIFGKSNPYSYPIKGYEKTVSNISNDDVKNFYAQYFTPDRSYLVVVGDTNKDELEDKLNRHFIDWKPGKNNITTSTDTSITSNQPGFYYVDKKDAVQSEIRVGHLSQRRDLLDYFPKLILNTILGGQFSSRLNLNLREKHGYTYGASSMFSYYKENAHFFVSTSVGIENTSNALDEIIKELNEIKNGITTVELDFAKSSIIRKFPLQFETYTQIASNLIGMIKYSLPVDYFNKYLDNVKNVSKEDINGITKKNIFPDKLLITVVGDKEKLLKQAGDFNLSKIVEVDLNGEKIEK